MLDIMLEAIMKNKYYELFSGLIAMTTCLLMLVGCTNNPITHITRSSTTTTSNVSSTSTNSTNGLSLSLSLDTTIYQSGQGVLITVDEQNILSTPNNVPSVYKWALSGLSLSPCGTNSFPFGVAVFQGDYTTTGVLTATPLVLYNPNELPPCPAIPAIAEYDFLPSSDLANEIVDNEFNSETIPMNQSITVTYYWPGSGKNITQHDFETGIYTVAGGDEWGNLVVVHFTVS
jgi:hypothetical protein